MHDGLATIVYFFSFFFFRWQSMQHFVQNPEPRWVQRWILCFGKDGWHIKTTHPIFGHSYKFSQSSPSFIMRPVIKIWNKTDVSAQHGMAIKAPRALLRNFSMRNHQFFSFSYSLVDVCLALPRIEERRSMFIYSWLDLGASAFDNICPVLLTHASPPTASSCLSSFFWSNQRDNRDTNHHQSLCHRLNVLNARRHLTTGGRARDVGRVLDILLLWTSYFDSFCRNEIKYRVGGT